MTIAFLDFGSFTCTSTRQWSFCLKIATCLFTLGILLFALFVSCWKRKWFVTDSKLTNPYKTILKVLSFAWKHKNPLRRTAFAYNDDYIPSRLDFAKERFGGPFTTEQVEDVKVVGRMITVLVVIGPALVLEVPGSELVFPLFGLHTLSYINTFEGFTCNATFEDIWSVLVASGSFMSMASILVLFPMYMWIIFYHLRNRMPKVFTRIGIGIVLSLTGVASLFIVDVLGHSINKASDINQTQCVFQFHVHRYQSHTSMAYPTLNLHWAVLIVPSLFLKFGPLLVITTTFEFISAQSPTP